MLGQGSDFSIFLPATPDKKPQENISTAKKSQSPRRTCHILMMDDEEDLCLIAREILEDLGCTLTIVPEGDKALEVVKGSNTFFDMAILDLTIPGGKGGEEIAIPLRKLSAKTILIASSGLHQFPGPH